MAAVRQVHLVRHGEVDNPQGVLYGRLPGYHLSALGQRMAQAAADELAGRRRSLAALIASPLTRTQESAAPIAAAFSIGIGTDERVVEPGNRFEGTVMARAARNPLNWPWLINPLRPSWGEAYSSIARRMSDAVTDAFAQPWLSADEAGDVVIVSHQLPIWIEHLTVVGGGYVHDPRHRRCTLSSITTFEQRGMRLFEVGYADPAAPLAESAVDVGAV
ncbi:histidine phosphatase family protein [Gryllotalpicola sp.]|uniref:histidine phosphatase family protein n=1 Tax=Gryllotalpicola sp. TaxID=1932787 RepID=UPI00260E9B72|nr:histidine phosphatase family protein [Gryllotalpicola sp.]